MRLLHWRKQRNGGDLKSLAEPLQREVIRYQAWYPASELLNNPIRHLLKVRALIRQELAHE